MSESKTPIANIFGSKVLRSEPKRSDKKNLIWDYFIQSDKDLSKALCNLCGGVYSMGSDKPKIQTTTNLKNHLKAKHFNEFKKFLDNCDAAKEKKEKRIREEDCDSIPQGSKRRMDRRAFGGRFLPR